MAAEVGLLRDGDDDIVMLRTLKENNWKVVLRGTSDGMGKRWIQRFIELRVRSIARCDGDQITCVLQYMFFEMCDSLG